jgi:hypothetical protein
MATTGQDTPNTIIEITDNQPLFLTKNGEMPFWDHPYLKGSKALPDKYYPYTTIEGALSLVRTKRLDEDGFTLLKVLGDAICANEDQIRRYMSTKMSRSDTSKLLNRFRTNGLADRWKIRIRGQEEEFKPPAPFTLGIGGYKLLKHFYNDEFFMNPNLWDDYGVGGVKRYVSMNELRCQLVEQRALKKWKWRAVIGNNPKLKFPLAAAELSTPNGNINLLIDRAQMSQNYIGFFRERLEEWKTIYEKYGEIPVSDFPNNLSCVVIYTSTLTVAEHIHRELMLDTFPYNIWICVEEDLLETNVNTSFYIPNGEKLKRIKLEL